MITLRKTVSPVKSSESLSSRVHEAFRVYEDGQASLTRCKITLPQPGHRAAIVVFTIRTKNWSKPIKVKALFRPDKATFFIQEVSFPFEGRRVHRGSTQHYQNPEATFAAQQVEGAVSALAYSLKIDERVTRKFNLSKS